MYKNAYLVIVLILSDYDSAMNNFNTKKVDFAVVDAMATIPNSAQLVLKSQQLKVL